jgi:hypothetical protein
VGLRHGTVMAGSRLPLLTWFAAIKAILERPVITTGELMEVTQIARPTTVRSLRRKVLEALASATSTEALAGLDQVFPPTRTC